MSSAVQWVESTSWELPFFGLPGRIPWPAEVEPAEASKDPFEVDHLIEGIRRLGAEARPPFSSYLAASDYFDALIEALEENELAGALQALNDIDRVLPETAFALYHRAYIARREGSLEEAIRLYRAAGEKTPEISTIWSSLGALHAMRQENEEAVGAFRKALEIQPNDLAALEGMASLRQLVKLRSADPSQPEQVRYVDLPTFGRLSEQRIATMTNPEELFQYGDQLLRDNLFPAAAVRALERSAEIAPAQPRTMHALAAAYRINGQPEQGLQVLQRLTQTYPQDPHGWMHLAQASQAAGEEGAHRHAIEQALRLEPNFQPALAEHFALAPGEHDPAKEDALAAFGEANQSWMAYLLADALARERGDHRASLRHAERAYALAPDQEEVLLHYASALASNKELARLAGEVRPAMESGRFSKRLEWQYAQLLRSLNLNREAEEVLQRAVTGEVPDDFRQMVTTTLDSWNNLVTGCGVRLELMGQGFLQRPILISLADGDGGILVQGSVQLPQEAKFTWRAQGERASVPLQQGESGGQREVLRLGVFRVSGISPSPQGATTIDCHLVALPDGAIHFRALQAGRKLTVGWALREVV